MNAVVVSILEVLVVGFTVWGLFNEEKFANLEERIVCSVRRKKLKVIKGGKHADKNCA